VGACGLLAIAVRVLGCGVDPAPPDPTEGFDTEAMLTAYGHQIVFPTLNEFADALGVLDADIRAWEVALDTSDGREAREASQTSWRWAMAVWQRLELMQVGALGSSISTVGGEDLRDDIYSWPTVNACRVDQETLEGAYEAGDFFDVEFVNVRGLDALEHMLWSGEGETRCADGVEIIESGAWAATGVDGVQSARAGYARAIVDDVIAITDVLLDLWDPAGGDWGGVLASAGETDSVYEDRLQALDQVFAALFYVELLVKDRKLGQPLGLQGCDGDRCPDALESQFADLGLDHIRQNLDAARLVLTGGDGLGFDDLLAHTGRPDLATALLDALDESVAAVDAVEGTALEAIVDDPAALLAVHDALKAFTDILKGDFALTLLLDVPSDAANDND
jgi:hypothetical protein